MEKMTIETLASFDDAMLMEKLGLTAQLEKAKAAIKEMTGLTGKARTYAEERIERMFEPHVYPYDFEYIVKDAKRASKTGKEEMADCGCASVIHD